MPERPSSDQAQGTLVVRLWVPIEGELRGIASELAKRIAEHLGTTGDGAQSLGTTVEKLAVQLGHGKHAGGLISFDFRRVGSELIIEARCNGQASEVRHPLPA